MLTILRTGSWFALVDVGMEAFPDVPGRVVETFLYIHILEGRQ
jgi:hypothetical protein